MSAIGDGGSHRVSNTPKTRHAATAPTPREAASFTRATLPSPPTGSGPTTRPSGPKAVTAALIARCSHLQAALQMQGTRKADFLGRDGESLVFCSREREEVCIQSGLDVCTVKSDGRVFLNGDPLERHQSGFLQMQRRLVDLGERIAAGGLDRTGSLSSADSRSPWDPAAPAHVNYVL